MNWSNYGSYLVFAVILVLIPGADFAVVVRNTVVGGRRRGWWTAAGVSSAAATQGAAAATGLGTVIVRVQPLFEAVKWAGIAYLVYLAVQALVSAVRGRYPELPAGTARTGRAAALSGYRQGYLSNITNPKVLVFYLAVLPQFLDADAGFGQLFLYAASHAVIGFTYLMVLVAFLHQMRTVLARRAVRRGLDTVTGVALLGFGARLATEHV